MIISVVNQKGGVAKSTTTTSLASALAKQGLKVLVVDMDAQANSTVGLGIDDESLEHSLSDLLLSEKVFSNMVESVIIRTDYDNLYLLPSDISLASVENDLSKAMNREMILSKILRLVRDKFDYILIDCPPNLGLMSINALAASDKVIIPLAPGYFSAKGINHLYRTIEVIQENLKPDLDIMGILVTQFDARKKNHLDLREKLPGIFGEKLFETFIRVDTQVEHAQEEKTTVVYFNEKAKASQDYIKLAEEVIDRGRK